MKKRRGLRKFDIVEDEYDRLSEIQNQDSEKDYFTNKATLKKVEFDYEEDPYEPDVDDLDNYE